MEVFPHPLMEERVEPLINNHILDQDVMRQMVTNLVQYVATHGEQDYKIQFRYILTNYEGLYIIDESYYTSFASDQTVSVRFEDDEEEPEPGSLDRLLEWAVRCSQGLCITLRAPCYHLLLYDYPWHQGPLEFASCVLCRVLTSQTRIRTYCQACILLGRREADQRQDDQMKIKVGKPTPAFQQTYAGNGVEELFPILRYNTPLAVRYWWQHAQVKQKDYQQHLARWLFSSTFFILPQDLWKIVALSF
jgi:hypothetical protein